MTWFKVDDGFWSHPKTAMLSDAAIALWVRAGAYSCQHLTDGVISKPVLRMVGTHEAADELIACGLWIEVDDGWRFHDWEKYQETREAVVKRREAWRDRQKQSREKHDSKRGESRNVSRVTSNVTPDVTHDASNVVTLGVPSRPVPSITSNEVIDTSRIKDAFERAWKHWPKKVEKKLASERFARAAKKFDDVEVLVDHVARFGDAYAATTDKRYVPGLGVWIGHERWTDELPEVSRGSQPHQSKAAQNIQAYWNEFGGDDDPAGGMAAIGP